MWKCECVRLAHCYPNARRGLLTSIICRLCRIQFGPCAVRSSTPSAQVQAAAMFGNTYMRTAKGFAASA